jgi:hypothetical protein
MTRVAARRPVGCPVEIRNRILELNQGRIGQLRAMASLLPGGHHKPRQQPAGGVN